MDGVFGSANSTQDGGFTKLLFSPYRDGMILTLFMTLITGIVLVTTLEFNGDNVFLGMIMFASGL